MKKQTNPNRSFSYSNRSSKYNQKETIVGMMQREIDKYTQKLEIDKKKVYSLIHTLGVLKKEYEDRRVRVRILKKASEAQKNKIVLVNIQTILKQKAHYEKKKDEVLDKINIVKENINKLRRERLAFFEQYQTMHDNLDQLNNQAENLSEFIEKKKSKAQQTQNQMFDLKYKNEEEKENYKKQLELLSRQIDEEKRQKDILNKTVKRFTDQDMIDNFDTSTVLRRRLQKKIMRNKEKVQIMDQYMRNMSIIDEAFNQIKETTGMTDISEIQNTFIKSEEQNYALLTYVDLLNQQIDNYEDQVQELLLKVQDQEKENNERKKILHATSDDDKFKKKVDKILEKKTKNVKEFQVILDQLYPEMVQLLQRLAESKFNTKNPHKIFEYKSTILLNESTLSNYLSDLDDFIYEILLYEAKKNNINQTYTSALLLDEVPLKEFKQKLIQNVNVTPNNVGEDQPGDANRLLDESRLKEIALDLLDKKKIPLVREQNPQKQQNSNNSPSTQKNSKQ